MQSNELPPMEPLAPIVDRMRELAAEELPASRSCRVELWEDGTFDIRIFHSMPGDDWQQLTYERTTGEILWEHFRGAQQETESFSEGETLHTTSYEEVDVRVVDTVEPPYSGDN